MSLDTTTHD